MLESDYLSGHNLVTTIIAIHLDPHHGSPLSPCIFPCTSQPLHTSPLSMGAGLSLLNVPLHQVSPESWRSCSQCTALSFLPNQSKGPGGFPHPRPLLLSELCPPSFLLPHLLQAHWPLAPLLTGQPHPLLRVLHLLFPCLECSCRFHKTNLFISFTCFPSCYLSRSLFLTMLLRCQTRNSGSPYPVTFSLRQASETPWDLIMCFLSFSLPWHSPSICISYVEDTDLFIFFPTFLDTVS